jgi:hypothetical protein
LDHGKTHGKISENHEKIMGKIHGKNTRGNIFGENDDFLEWENVGIGLPKRVDFPKEHGVFFQV